MNFGISLHESYHTCVVPPKGYMSIFSPFGPPRTEQHGLKVYIVSYTNEIMDSEAFSYISYF